MEMEEWTEMEIMKMRLGFQVLIHNVLMIGFILVLADFLGIFTDSVILLIGYGLLKLTAGGIHFKKSILCLLSTSAFIVYGVSIAGNINLSLYRILFIYLICMLILWKVAPQGTENNPISQKNYYKLKRETMIISGLYLLITIYELIVMEEKISNLLLVAIVFETVSLLLGYFLHRK